MKKGGGRAKGNAFERVVAHKIMDAFESFGITSSDVYRTPLSGGHIFAKKEDPGDLVISKKLRKFFPFHVECKFYRRVELWPLWIPIDKHKKAWKFKGWLEQTTRATSAGLTPLLVWKENLGPVFCMMPICKVVLRIKNHHRAWFRGNKWFVVLFDDLLEELVKEQQ